MPNETERCLCGSPREQHVNWGGPIPHNFGGFVPPTPTCRACLAPLRPENYRITDGCPCNPGRGSNHGLVPKDTCTCVGCDPAETGRARYPVTSPDDDRVAAHPVLWAHFENGELVNVEERIGDLCCSPAEAVEYRAVEPEPRQPSDAELIAELRGYGVPLKSVCKVSDCVNFDELLSELARRLQGS
jgi:hypothetical protein